MNELALFAGAGGGILGGKMLGWRTVCAVEWEPYPASVLCARQNDGVLSPFPIWDDIQTFDGKPWRGIVDVVSGGFPCQDISAAGKGAGIEGERSGMWKEMARIICEVRPKFVFVENSPMLTSRGLGRVLGDLAKMGFNARWGVLGAADVGAPHQRDRIWIVGKTTNSAINGLSKQTNKFIMESQGRGQFQSSEPRDSSNVANTNIVNDAMRRNSQDNAEAMVGRELHTRRSVSNSGTGCKKISGESPQMADTTKLLGNGGNDNAGVSVERETQSKLRNGRWSEDVANAGQVGFSGSQTKQGMGGKFRFAVSSLESGWWNREPAETPRTVERGLGRMANGVAARVDRLKAIGNGQVPLCAATAWRILSEL